MNLPALGEPIEFPCPFCGRYCVHVFGGETNHAPPGCTRFLELDTAAFLRACADEFDLPPVGKMADAPTRRGNPS